jgi:glutamyl-tRNA synthetase
MAAKNPEIRVRMAPSPTGLLHIGTARTALFNWLFARHQGGVFIVRIEDTDTTRSKPEYETEILEGLRWLGIAWDEGPGAAEGEDVGDFGPYRQSDRTAIYRTYLEQLLANGNAYYCYCSKEDLEAQKQVLLSQGLPPKYNGHCRPENNNSHEGKNPEVIRFKVPEITVEFKDIVRGNVSFDAALFGDIVIAKNLDNPLYNFAVVVDDEAMKISHVIRGEEHIGNTPRQILLLRALGFTEPVYAHIPLILNADRSKMSKRLGNAALLSEFRELGYLPEAIVNFLALMGWHPKGDKELFTLDELAQEFELERVQKGGAVFNQEKLDWLNKEHMKKYSDRELALLARPFIEKTHPDVDMAFFERLVSIERSRVTTLGDFAATGNFFFHLPEYETALLILKDSSQEEAKGILEEIFSAVQKIDANDFQSDKLRPFIMSLIGERKRGVVLSPLRVALSGLASSPDSIDIMAVLGKKESLTRIEIAIKKLSS